MCSQTCLLLVTVLVIFGERFSTEAASLSRKQTVHKRSNEAAMAPCFEHINSLRERHGALPLKWGKYEAEDAVQWARHINKIQELQKDPQGQNSDPEGELLAMISNEGATPADKCIIAVDRWYSQFSLYKSAGGCDSDNGVDGARDFTQLVWKSTHSVGIAVVGNVVDIRLFPPGNFEEEYSYDVQC